MPYIAFRTSKTLTPTQKEAVKSGFGKLISTLPTKSERGLLVDISDGHTFYFHGEAADAAYVDIKLYGESPAAAKEELTLELFKMLGEAVGLGPKDVYINYDEYQSWGSNGALNQK
ncbi:hypothetical protein FACS1894191_2810 [Clostridia bacterium]|nr:hypothetical protein FACS1894191_2810 [Clostridia bacterium]